MSERVLNSYLSEQVLDSYLSERVCPCLDTVVSV